MADTHWQCDCDKYNPDCRCYPREEPMPDLIETVARVIDPYAWDEAFDDFEPSTSVMDMRKESKAKARVYIAAAFAWLAQQPGSQGIHHFITNERGGMEDAVTVADWIRTFLEQEKTP